MEKHLACAISSKHLLHDLLVFCYTGIIVQAKHAQPEGKEHKLWYNVNSLEEHLLPTISGTPRILPINKANEGMKMWLSIYFSHSLC